MDDVKGRVVDDEAPMGIARLPLSFTPSLHTLGEVLAILTPFYGARCPISAVFEFGGTREKRVEATLGTLLTELDDPDPRTAPVLFIG